MHLRSAHIRHYKSLEDVKVEFTTPVTVIVGPNGAGKSNLVDCLRFVRDAVVDGLELAVAKRGGFDSVRQRSSDQRLPLSVSLGFEQTFPNTRFTGTRYEFAVAAAASRNFEVESESAEYISEQSDHDFDAIARQRPTPDHWIRNRTGKVIGEDSDDLSGLFNTQGLTVLHDRLALGTTTWFGQVGRPLADFVSNWRFANFYANTLRDNAFADAGTDTALSANAANWAVVLHSQLSEDTGQAVVRRINECMQAVVPEYREVSVRDQGGILVPTFRLALAGQPVEFNARQVSDGTLRVFAILLALYLAPPESLLLIEEPEQTVHPGVLAVLVEAIREVSELTQIIVTTHSPQLVDLFKPEEIRVVTMQDGHTHIAPIAKNQVEAVKQHLMSLAEFMQAEGLQPDPEQ
jgi:predicted ATPase